MINRLFLYTTLIILFCIPKSINAQEVDDPYLWLEEIDGTKALDWVKAQNNATLAILEKFPAFQEINKRNFEIYNSKDRIASPSIYGDYIYNFWQDEKNERGVWRRTTLNEYLKESPNWEVILDIDMLSKAENEKWVFHGASFLPPNFNHCIVSISRGGGDADIKREIDLTTKQFVKDGFYLPEAKSETSWKDENTLYVMTKYGEGSLTESGYPRIAKIWKRGTPLSEAKTIFEGEIKDVSVSAYTIYTPERNYDFVHRGITFYTAYVYAIENGKLIKLDIQDDAQFDGIFKNQILLELKTDWNVSGKIYPQGALISIDYDKFIKGDRNFDIIWKPGERSSIVSVSNTKNYLLVNQLNNVRSELYKYSWRDGKWSNNKVETPDYGTIYISSTDELSDQYFFTYTSFLVPTSLYFVLDDNRIQKVKSLPEYFDGSKYEVQQFEATSKDGTHIPYFLIHKKEIKPDGSNPTLLYAYGGFEISLLPSYSGILGTAWLERGGVYAYANLRGGGEFGPKWHLSAIKENRQKVNEDMIAVSEDLIVRKITSTKHLGIQGGSNGGLLVGSAYTQRPDLYSAVVCQVPLLDMKRYNKLLAGASWMGEYGNPDIPDEWAYIGKYSPYQNISADKKYPKILLMTSTRDDRVHPGHARKMAAKLESMKIPFYYYENTEGGHSAGVTNKQKAFENALAYTYLLMQLKQE
ncbi:MAG: prolyl oligopeptidase family serine peptidase [Bacteroidota bacterium]